MAINNFKGISFPFRFNSRGTVETSELTHTDFSRIKESIQQILFTYKMERIMNPQLGTERGHIFDPMGDLTSHSVTRFNIIKAIEEQEPRVAVNDVLVYTEEGEEAMLVIEVDVHIIKYVKDVKVQINIEKEYLNGGDGLDDY